MPVLHKYKDREGHYVLTSINKTMVTFQLTLKGEERLLSSGIRYKETFNRGLLLDLYRSGDAYTYGTGPGEEISRADSHQLEFDFKNDPDPESLFPTCAHCSSPIGLHLVEVKEDGHTVSILCIDCRLPKLKAIDTSIPLPLVTRGILNRLLEMKNIEKIDSSVLAYKELLDKEFQSKWDALAKIKKSGKGKQKSLFDKTDEKQKKLI
jgi:hypothetical protein